MASSNETGHVKNVNNLEDLITICIGYGGAYNPSKNSIKITVLNQLLTDSKTELANVNKKLTDYNIAVTNRQLIFKDLKKLSTRLVNALGASDTNSKTIENANSINRKIQGVRASTKEAPTTPESNSDTTEVKAHSVSQQSYGLLTEHFSKLILLLQSESNYNPNEELLKVTNLNTLLSDMNTNNATVLTANTEVNNARINRNELFYISPNCLFNTAAEVKKYVKSLFGATSQQYKQISGIKFTMGKM